MIQIRKVSATRTEQLNINTFPASPSKLKKKRNNVFKQKKSLYYAIRPSKVGTKNRRKKRKLEINRRPSVVLWLADFILVTVSPCQAVIQP